MLPNSRTDCLLGPSERCFACRLLAFLASSLLHLAILQLRDPGLRSAPTGEPGTRLPQSLAGIQTSLPAPGLAAYPGLHPPLFQGPFASPRPPAGPASCSRPSGLNAGSKQGKGLQGPEERERGIQSRPTRPGPLLSTSSAACRSGLDSIFIYYNL